MSANTSTRTARQFVSSAISIESTDFGLRINLDSCMRIRPYIGGPDLWYEEYQQLLRNKLAPFLPNMTYDPLTNTVTASLVEDGKEWLHDSRDISQVKKAAVRDELNRLLALIRHINEEVENTNVNSDRANIVRCFRLPDPERSPEFYRVYTKGRRKHIAIIWGMEHGGRSYGISDPLIIRILRILAQSVFWRKVRQVLLYSILVLSAFGAIYALYQGGKALIGNEGTAPSAEKSGPPLTTPIQSNSGQSTSTAPAVGNADTADSLNTALTTHNVRDSSGDTTDSTQVSNEQQQTLTTEITVDNGIPFEPRPTEFRIINTQQQTQDSEVEVNGGDASSYTAGNGTSIVNEQEQSQAATLSDNGSRVSGTTNGNEEPAISTYSSRQEAVSNVVSDDGKGGRQGHMTRIVSKRDSTSLPKNAVPQFKINMVPTGMPYKIETIGKTTLEERESMLHTPVRISPMGKEAFTHVVLIVGDTQQMSDDSPAEFIIRHSPDESLLNIYVGVTIGSRNYGQDITTSVSEQ